MDRANSQATNIGFTGLRRWIYIFCAFWSLPTDLEEKKTHRLTETSAAQTGLDRVGSGPAGMARPGRTLLLKTNPRKLGIFETQNKHEDSLRQSTQKNKSRKTDTVAIDTQARGLKFRVAF